MYKDDTTKGTGPAELEDGAPFPNLLEQEPPGFDERAGTPHPEHKNAPSPTGYRPNANDNQQSQSMSDPEPPGDEGGQQEDNNPVPGPKHNQMIYLVDPMTGSSGTQMTWYPILMPFITPQALLTDFVWHCWITTPSHMKSMSDCNPCLWRFP
jgi:hypothetical protein